MDSRILRKNIAQLSGKELGLDNAQKVEFQTVHRNRKNMPKAIIDSKI